MLKVKSESQLVKLLDSFSNDKHLTNSYFLKDGYLDLMDRGVLHYITFGSNLVFFESRLSHSFFELFFVLQNLEESFDLRETKPMVMEIPYRGEKFFPTVLVDYWLKNGFKRHMIRGLFSLQSKKVQFSETLENNVVSRLISDVKYADDILNQIQISFDRYTGDMLEIDNIITSIYKNEIIGSFVGGKLAGFLKFYNKKNVSWIGHIVINDNYRGMGIGKRIVQFYLDYQIKQGVRSFQQWVAMDNWAAIKLYERFGFKYINKNSISLLKL